MSIPSSVAEFRSDFQRERFPRFYSGTVHLLLTVGASFAVAVYCLFQLREVQPLEWLTIPVTFLYANLTEYVA
ncbi:MAG TPA: fatty acid hydroxylase family protein, partial [Terriglobia bacterium]|nr:fatty acid hydroxylase family protein [Terriglobia bacterium]